MRKLWIFILVTLISEAAYGAECNAGGFYCVSDKEVQLCPDVGKSPTGQIFACPQNTFCYMSCDLECTTDSDPCTIIITTPTTTITTTTKKPITECTESGKFPDPTNCTNYYICSPTTTGDFIKYYYSCPGDSLFNPDTKTCSLGPVNCFGGPPVTTVAPPVKCTGVGKIPDPTDVKNYYICSLSVSGEYILYKYACPGNSVFNPNSLKCTLTLK